MTENFGTIDELTVDKTRALIKHEKTRNAHYGSLANYYILKKIQKNEFQYERDSVVAIFLIIPVDVIIGITGVRCQKTNNIVF